MAETPPDGAERGDWRGIDALAALVGHFGWLEWQLFTVTGAWGASAEGDPACRVWSAAAARRHGELARQWAARLPVRAGVDAGALVVAPSAEASEAFARLGTEPSAETALAVVVTTVLPRLAECYGALLTVASPVREAAVAEVLVAARRNALGEARSGRSVVRHVGDGSAPGSPDAGLVTVFERVFDNLCVFPAVRTS